MTNGLFDYSVQASDKAQEIIEKLYYELLWVNDCVDRQRETIISNWSLFHAQRNVEKL